MLSRSKTRQASMVRLHFHVQHSSLLPMNHRVYTGWLGQINIQTSKLVENPIRREKLLILFFLRPFKTQRFNPT